MKSLFVVLAVLMPVSSAFAGLKCTNFSEGIEEFYLGYSPTKGCFMTLNKTDDTDYVTNVLNPGTTREEYACKEIVVGTQVITEATMNIDPSLLEPGESYPDVTIRVQGGVKNLQLTFILIPNQYEWTFSNFTCVQTSDLE